MSGQHLSRRAGLLLGDGAPAAMTTFQQPTAVVSHEP